MSPAGTVEGEELPELPPKDIDTMMKNLKITNTDLQYLNPHLAIKRPGFCDVGKGIMINVNSYRVTSYPTKRIQQYDVSLL